MSTLSPVNTPVHSPGPRPWTAPLRRKAREWKWRYAKNLVPSLKYRLQRGIHLSDEGRRILAALDRDGFAVSSIEKLFGDDSHLEAMADYVHRREEEIRGQVEEARAAAGRVGPKKAFTLDLLGETPWARKW